MKNTGFKWLFLTMVGFFIAPVFSSTISGEITFLKKPPKFAVVYVDDGGKLAPQSLNQKNKAFTNDVVLSSTGSSVTLLNQDEVEHNIYSNDSSSGVEFDVGLMPPGSKQSLSVDWEKDSLVRVGCKIHPKMRSYIATIDSLHYQMFEFDRKKKSFSINIDNVPDSATLIKILMPKYDPIEINLGPGSKSTVKLTKKGSEKGSVALHRGL
ncbi:hypothetical protein OAV62_00415 [bacterium]|nr:hypothetical protein [bacterium]